ncbi:hypothetical protein [Hymenobacter koreensis]|uniref:Lipocalin-like domain-containing protein n=1 Tax=Hymenobacter koreensis TaxID=1084523 RepID=A0ABP8J143_9BACT
MKKLSVYLSLAIAIAGLAACEKELEEVTQPTAKAEAAAVQSPKELLATAPWRQTGLTTTSKDVSAQKDVTVNVFARLKPALRDNTAQYFADGRYVLDEGASKANEAVEQQKTGSYQLSDDGKTLTVTLDGAERVYQVEELTATGLRLKVTDGEGDAAVSYTSSFGH